MTEYLEYADLASHTFDVCLLDDLLLLEGFNGHFLSGGDVDSQPDLAEGALADGLACITSPLPMRYCPRTNSLPDVLI